jgi:hypothetical protein
MTAPSKIFEGFSISHAQILDGTTDFVAAAFAAYDEDFDIYGVSDASLDPDTDSFDNAGDNVNLSTWNWLNKVDIALQAGYISLPLAAEITGRPVTTLGTLASSAYRFDIWHEDDYNVSSRPLLLKCPSKDNRGVARDLLIGIYSFGFGAMTFDGPSDKDGLKVNYNGTANYSLYDEVGTAFPDGKKRVACLVSVGKVVPAP